MMPLADYGFSSCFGCWTADRYGVSWQVGTAERITQRACNRRPRAAVSRH